MTADDRHANQAPILATAAIQLAGCAARIHCLRDWISDLVQVALRGGGAISAHYRSDERDNDDDSPETDHHMAAPVGQHATDTTRG